MAVVLERGLNGRRISGVWAGIFLSTSYVTSGKSVSLFGEFSFFACEMELDKMLFGGGEGTSALSADLMGRPGTFSLWALDPLFSSGQGDSICVYILRALKSCGVWELQLPDAVGVWSVPTSCPSHLLLAHLLFG